MLLFSQILGRPVVDAKGISLGKLKDLIASGGRYPMIKALIVDGPNHTRLALAWAQVDDIQDRVELKVSKREVVPYETEPGDIFLSEQVLDRQLTDLHGLKVGRVNDVQLAKPNGHYRVLAIDASARGLLRRLGVDRAVSLVGIRPQDHLIPWEKVNLLQDPTPTLQITVPSSTIPRIHPSDLADIVEQLSVSESADLIEAMDDETAADTLEEVSSRRQIQILRDMDSARAADILEEMGPDEAADVLGDMPAKEAAKLLSLMDEDESQDVKELLAYPEDTAGGIMTTEYISLLGSLTVQEATERLRDLAREVDYVYSLYVVDRPEEERLIGTLTLRDLIIAAPSQTLSELMNRSPVTVRVTDRQEVVAKVIAKYNLLAAPVVDNLNRLQGVVTVDDAMDILLPVAYRKRLPRMFSHVTAGGTTAVAK
ncbi:MAG: CBS domain-containing protein [Bacteroidetes bacterium]|nr:CBS domain-containing protein [Bacteroidota bacterium]